MLTTLDHTIIAVRDLDAASSDYARLLGREPSWRGAHPELGTANALFRLANGYLELLAPVAADGFARWLHAHLAERGEGLLGLAFGTDDAEDCAKSLAERGVAVTGPLDGHGRDERSGAERRWRYVLLPREATRGVLLFAIEHLSPADALPLSEPADPAAAVEGIDHVVVNSEDAEATCALYGERLGLRLALDRRDEERGVRLLFFRVGGVTIEVAARLATEPRPEATDRLWGLAYRVPDVAAAHERLATSGCDVSRVRGGRKPGTRVCTVRSPTHGVATLVIGPEAA